MFERKKVTLELGNPQLYLHCSILKGIFWGILFYKAVSLWADIALISKGMSSSEDDKIAVFYIIPHTLAVFCVIPYLNFYF